MAITPPTRTAGSLGTTKSDNVAVSNEPQQLASSDYNACADNLIAVINQSNANEAALGTLLTETKADSTSAVFSFNLAPLPADSDLLLSWKTREVGASGAHLSFQANVDTGNNYTTISNKVAIPGGGSINTNGNGVDHIHFGGSVDNGGEANRWAWGRALVPDYKNASDNKVTWGRAFVNESNTNARYDILSGSYDIVGALTSIEIKNSSGGLFLVGSVVRVLAVPKGTIGL